MLEFISQPWPWYVSGPAIAVITFLLLWVGQKFGMSTSYRTICTMCGVGKNISYFDFDWKAQTWNLVFIVGTIIGGFIAQFYLNSGAPLSLSTETIQELAAFNISFSGELVPESIFSWDNLMSVKGFLIMVMGGFLVGFGARWAGGCTSGHAISGLSNLQLPSLIAVIGFFVGGLIMTHLLFPLIF